MIFCVACLYSLASRRRETETTLWKGGVARPRVTRTAADSRDKLPFSSFTQNTTMDYLSNAFFGSVREMLFNVFYVPKRRYAARLLLSPAFFYSQTFFYFVFPTSFYRRPIVLSVLFTFPSEPSRIRLAVVSLNFSRLISLCHEICSPRPRRRGSTTAGLTSGSLPGAVR